MREHKTRFTYDNGDLDSAAITKFVGWCTLAVVGVCLAIWVIAGLVGPQLRRYGVETERKARISEARSIAEADRIRAAGTADANATIAESLTDAYIRWLYVDQMDELQGQVIYVPTEGGLPILEAERLSQGGGQ